jgi:hypothetical protein
VSLAPLIPMLTVFPVLREHNPRLHEKVWRLVPVLARPIVIPPKLTAHARIILRVFTACSRNSFSSRISADGNTKGTWYPVRSQPGTCDYSGR